MELLLPIMIAIVSIFLTYRLAIKKGLNVKSWVIMAIIFGIFVLPFIFLAKNNQKENTSGKRIDRLEA